MIKAKENTITNSNRFKASLIRGSYSRPQSTDEWGVRIVNDDGSPLTTYDKQAINIGKELVIRHFSTHYLRVHFPDFLKTIPAVRGQDRTFYFTSNTKVHFRRHKAKQPKPYFNLAEILSYTFPSGCLYVDDQLFDVNLLAGLNDDG